jgi:hypothetical protein
MKAMNAVRRSVRSALGCALALIAVEASAEPAPPAKSPEPARNQTDEPTRERGEPAEEPAKESEQGPAEQPAKEQPRERPEQVQESAETDERPSASAEHPEKPVPGQVAQAGPGQDGARERRVPKGNANQRNVSKPPVLGERAATGIVYDRGPTENGSPRTPWGIEVGLGPLVAWVPDDSFDLFSDSGYWPAFAVRVGSSIWHSGPVDVAVSGAYHYAATNGAARQTPTELTLHRFLVGGQARYHLLSWFAPCGRLLAGLSYLTSELGSGDQDQVSTLSSFDFSALASAGVQARILEVKRSALLVHLYVEGGGIFTSNTRLVYQIGSGGPPRSQPVDAGTLSLTGPQLETGVLALF